MRPEYIKCIQSDKEGVALCGRSIYLEWAFIDVKHTEATSKSGSRLLPCSACLKKTKEFDLI